MLLFLWACTSADIEISIANKADLGATEETTEESVVEPTSTPEPEDIAEPSNNEPSHNEPSHNEPSREVVLDNALCGDTEVGKDIEMCVPNIVLPNVDNMMVSLHDFAGNVILLDMSDYG